MNRNQRTTIRKHRQRPVQDARTIARPVALEPLESRTLMAVGAGVSAPLPVTVTAVDETRLVVAWVDHSTNETHFALERAVGRKRFQPLATLPADSTGYSDTGLLPDTRYRYRVRAVTDAAASKWAAGRGTTAPWSVEEAAAQGRVELSWTDYWTDETGYVVKRATGKGRLKKIATLPAGTTEYADTSVSYNTTYAYTVTAVSGGRKSRPGRGQTTTPPEFVAQRPAAPSSLAVVATSWSRVELAWLDNSLDELGFKVELSGNGQDWHQVALLPSDVTRYAAEPLDASNTYLFRVRAYNAAGDSAYSNDASATTPARDTTSYSGPLVITRGGTYTGNWESLDPNVAAVTIRTTEPVVIEGANVRGRGVLIETAIDGADVTVRNTRGYGMNPNVYGLTPGRFFEADRFDNVVLENNYLEGTGGIKLLEYSGDFTTSDSVRVVGNSALNIDGRRSDGAGGYLDFDERTRLSDGYNEKGYKIRQFIQLDKVQNVPGIEIAWNHVVNEPGRSRVEDNINIYMSSGTPGSPIRIHDNYIRGAYTIKPWLGGTSTDGTWEYDWGYAGGGILLGDGDSGVAYVEAYGNTVVNTTNYGIAIAAGHDTRFYNNRVLSSGRLPDGRWIPEQNVGVYIWDLYGAGLTGFYNNSAHDNLVGWVNEPDGSRNAWWIPNATLFEGNVHWAGEITAAVETEESALWQQRRAAAGVLLPAP